MQADVSRLTFLSVRKLDDGTWFSVIDVREYGTVKLNVLDWGLCFDRTVPVLDFPICIWLINSD